jgi:hypothetical protein
VFKLLFLLTRTRIAPIARLQKSARRFALPAAQGNRGRAHPDRAFLNFVF